MVDVSNDHYVRERVYVSDKIVAGLKHFTAEICSGLVGFYLVWLYFQQFALQEERTNKTECLHPHAKC